MALRDPHRAAPPGRRPHSWIPSTSTAGALDLVSRHQHAVAGHTLQPLSAYSIGASTALYDLGDALPFMPGCCVLSISRFVLLILPLPLPLPAPLALLFPLPFMLLLAPRYCVCCCMGALSEYR